MADEESVQQESTPQEKTTVTEKVTDDVLASAYDADQKKQPVVEVKTEITENTETTEEGDKEPKEEHHESTDEPPEEPDDNKERSRLGRRMKSIEEKFDSFLSKLDAQAQQSPVQQSAQIPANATYNDTFIQAQMEAAVARGELPSTIVTPQDQLVVNNFINGLHSYMGNQYAVGYISTLKSPKLKGDTPDDIHAEVVAELQRIESPFNLRRYDNPQLDAQLNYLEAKSSILAKKLSTGKPANVFKGKPKDAPATGTSVSTRTASAVNDLPELDEAAQDFIKKTGMSSDSVKAALKADMPLHLRGGFR